MANTSVSVRSYTSADRRSTDRCSTAESYYKPGSVNSCSKSSTGSGREENLTPRLFLDRYSLPRVVKILPQEPVSDDSLDAGPLALFTGQLLMYRQYRSGKVEARSEVKTKHGSDLISLVVIPDTYQGWFSVVTERGQVKARCYNSIHRMVSAQVTAFLNMSDVVAYTHNNRTSADGTRQQYSKTNIRPGQVLKLLAVYQDLANQSTRSKRLSWPLIGRTEANRYAQCLTSTDQVLFIPVTTHGQFYAVATATNTTEDTVTKVYQLSKLLRTFPLPVRVCIVTANKPQGSMLLESYRKEDVILTCILPTRDEDSTDTSQFRLLEIDVNSRFYVARAGKRDSDERRLFHSPPVQNALRFCRENGERWCRQLKVIHHIYPRENTVERKENTKPRKVSLGDKKTVKSASFRFSTSYLPEDLRPINRPLPRRPIESKPRPPIKQDYSYDSQHLYSKVAEETEEPISSRLPIESEHKTVWAKPMERSAEKNLRSIKSENELLTKPERRNKGEEFKTKIVVHNNNHLSGFDENNYANNNAKYRVVRKTVNHQPTISAKPFFKTRVQIGADYSSGSDLPYSVVADQISTHDDNVYAEIGDTYPTSDVSYFSFDYQRRLRRYDYHHGGSDGTFSGTTTSSSNAEESSV